MDEITSSKSGNKERTKKAKKPLSKCTCSVEQLKLLIQLGECSEEQFIKTVFSFLCKETDFVRIMKSISTLQDRLKSFGAILKIATDTRN